VVVATFVPACVKELEMIVKNFNSIWAKNDDPANEFDQSLR
jgi:hypothetical protein